MQVWDLVDGLVERLSRNRSGYKRRRRKYQTVQYATAIHNGICSRSISLDQNEPRFNITCCVTGHVLDVNAVAFMDDTSQIFVSGSDDADIKLWDRRILGQDTAPAGVLVGHLEGITHIDAKGDGRYLISNSKDQTIKLWDVRKMVSEAVADGHRQTRNSTMPHLDWDYRSDPVKE